ncbi:GNAT family N-acetyltransferase [Streptomyces sp. G45]|uniref:GNAT family N-acetyltransferase n=1 Tax=Streptomyces sp. G45 TaxID=3406627 RepID=UPI003C1A6C0A
MDITIRRVRPDEYAALGTLTAEVYADAGLLAFDEADGYREQLRDVAGRDAAAEVLVAVEGERLLGGVTYVPSAGGPLAEICRDGEAEIRMLAVGREARGRGAGEALVRDCARRARAAGRTALVLSTQPAMGAAQRLYVRLGFVRAPRRDWEPLPGLPLLAYALPL